MRSGVGTVESSTVRRFTLNLAPLDMVSPNSIRLSEETETLAASLIAAGGFPAVRIVRQRAEAFAISRNVAQLSSLRAALAVASTPPISVNASEGSAED